MNNTTEWDKTNIGENYPGVTSPLTYSFIQNAYSKVYPNFLTLLGYNPDILTSYNYVFNNLLGYINGEVFYNINNWYELVKLLPGYSFNKGFFENMLDPVKRQHADKSGFRLDNFVYELPELLKFIWHITFISGHYREFDSQFEKHSVYYNRLKLSEISNTALARELDYLETKFFGIWGHTIVNDFRVMVYFGLYTLLLKHLLSEDTRLVSAHLRGLTKKPESVLVLERLKSIAHTVKQKNIELTSLVELKKHHGDIYILLEDYINSYGERSFNELKLEQPNFVDQPETLFALVKYYTELPIEALLQTKPLTDCSDTPTTPSNIFIRAIYTLLRNVSINSVHKREAFRLKRAKVFRVANEFFKEMGRRMAKEGVINRVEDIYFLYKHEILDTMNGHRLPDNLNTVVESRRKQLTAFGAKTLPRRVTKNGILEVVEDETVFKSKHTLRGRITASGQIHGLEVVTMPALDFSKDIRGKILVTHATDPGWTILFPMVKGLIIEVGGLLSHASIVARETGIPCVIVPDALKLLKDGDVVNLDEQSGVLTVVNTHKCSSVSPPPINI